MININYLMRTKEEIKDFIFLSMKKKKISQSALGEAFGAGGSYQNKQTKGRRILENPKFEDLPKIAEILGISVDEILLGEKKDNSNNETIQISAEEKKVLLSLMEKLKN